jgi:Mg2+ and Co2+ transporter CorA
MGRANSSGGNQQAAAAAAAEEEADAEAQQDVENLLESYYMQVDGLYDKLVSVGEYIKDTEEYINIELDSSRNRLIRFEIVLSVATFAIMPFNLLAGVLGENLIIPEQITGSVSQFFGVNIAATVFCCLIFYVITLYMRYTKLI